MNGHLFCYTRGQFEVMCADILTRLEAPLQSLLEQASEYNVPLSYPISFRTLMCACPGLYDNTVFVLNKN